MIEVKAPISGWHEINIDCARNYVKFLLQNMPNIRDENKVAFINKNKLRGITVEELLND